ncbi:MAG: putative membrane protein [Verrucomicrobiales bacterium]|jgi:uncharacterized membrane protein
MEFLAILILIAIAVLPFVALCIAISARTETKRLHREVDLLKQQLQINSIPPAQNPASPQEAKPQRHPEIANKVPSPSSTPPPIPTPVNKPPAISASSSLPAKNPINWEMFMGGKLFAWIGGLALFLGLAFFVRYSFEQNLISPATRVILGSIAGAGLLIGGWLVKRKTYEITSQTLCATGILTLYACVFASSHAFYGFFSMPVAFLLMTTVTAIAFTIAVRLNGQAVAVLGLLGGFLTPILLSTGSDHSLALFTYIAVLDIGLAAIAIKQRWKHLVALAATATLLTQIGWVMAHFTADKALVAMVIFIGFQILFCLILWWNNRSTPKEKWTLGSAVALSVTAMLFSLFLFAFDQLTTRPWIVLSYVFVVDLILLAIPFIARGYRLIVEAAAALTFCVLAVFTLVVLNDDSLLATLPFFVIFGLIHCAAPLLMRRLHPELANVNRKTTAPVGNLIHRLSQLTPLVTLFLLMLPMARGFYGFSIWPAALVVNAILIGTAVNLRSPLLALGASVLTFFLAAFYIVTIPLSATIGLNEVLVITLGFAGFFLVAAILAGNRLDSVNKNPFAALEMHPWLSALSSSNVLLSATSGILPFALLVLSMGRLSNLQNPSPIFFAALLLGSLLLFLARRNNITPLICAAFGGVFMVEAIWMLLHFTNQYAVLPLGWFLLFNAAFTAVPIFLHPEARRTALPWIVSSLSGILHYFLIFGAIKSTWTIGIIGIVPALMAIPPLLILAHLVKEFSKTNAPNRNRVLAWTGGAALFFITLIAPVQFDREWLTVAWALEGVALIWLFQRVPHVGLKATGVTLLAIAFARLTLNPFVFDYHPRTGLPFLNWYLWVYGISAACCFTAGKFLQPPREKLLGRSMQPLAFSSAVILTFYLLNIQIADFYSTGSRVAFEFSANFARDMTYSIAWALFAFPLLLAGFLRKLPACRYAGLALMSFTLLKLFLHDLNQLNQLYRIGALLGVAVIVIAASVLYQKFAPTQKPLHQAPSE